MNPSPVAMADLSSVKCADMYAKRQAATQMQANVRIPVFCCSLSRSMPTIAPNSIVNNNNCTNSKSTNFKSILLNLNTEILHFKIQVVSFLYRNIFRSYHFQEVNLYCLRQGGHWCINGCVLKWILHNNGRFFNGNKKRWYKNSY